MDWCYKLINSVYSKSQIAINLFLYNTGIFIYSIALRIASLFYEKARRFIRGRRNLFSLLEQRMQNDNRKKIWIHCASLGEFEQSRPVIEAIKERYPNLSIVLTFFSPSGYEVKKKYQHADHIFYLPLDTKYNAKRFIDLVQPQCALFVKYEFWYHYLHTLHQYNIPTVLFSAIFQPRHPFFKWYGGLHRKMLSFYQQIFVQDKASALLLQKINTDQVQIVGDTRFDRAARILEMDKAFRTIEVFKGTDKLIVAGSTWHEDERLLKKTLRSLPDNYKLLIAPHEVDDKHISSIQEMFPDSCLWATDEESFRNSRVCIVHTVGQLAYLYKYADLVWIGGGFTHSGIHNIIEPAVFGVPIFFGPNYKRYREAMEMIAAGAVQSIADAKSLTTAIQQENALLLMGNNAKKYVMDQVGATKSIVDYLSEKCLASIA
jgi:3-deoxy-D-manno-octulosonic-acid transferase